MQARRFAPGLSICTAARAKLRFAYIGPSTIAHSRGGLKQRLLLVWQSQSGRKGFGLFQREQVANLLALVVVGYPEKQISKARDILSVYEKLH